MFLLCRILFIVFTVYLAESNKRIVFMNFERPYITYENPKYFKIYNITSTRVGRRDPLHYLGTCIEAHMDVDNNIMIWLKFFEFLSNDYRPSFVQIHFKLCDFLRFVNNQVYKTKDISIPLARIEPDLNICHEEPAIYCLRNISVPVTKLPQVFPFEKGRMFFNATYKGLVISSGYVDMEVKMMPVIKYKNKN